MIKPDCLEVFFRPSGFCFVAEEKARTRVAGAAEVGRCY